MLDEVRQQLTDVVPEAGGGDANQRTLRLFSLIDPIVLSGDGMESLHPPDAAGNQHARGTGQHDGDGSVAPIEKLPNEHVDQDGRDEAKAEQLREGVGAEEFQHARRECKSRAARRIQVVLFEVVKGWLIGSTPDLGEVHTIRK